MNLNIESISKRNIYIAIGVLAALLFIPFLGSTHLFDWDEINFAECAREMIATKQYLRVYIDYMPFWEKPPLFFWMQATAMHIFGVNEFASRLPNAIAGIITLLLLFKIGSDYKNKTFGIIWVLFYAGSILPYFYFKSGIIDPIFNLFMFLSVTRIWYYEKSANIKDILLVGLFIGLAILVKGPVGYLVPTLSLGIYWLIRYKTTKLKIIHFIYFSLVSALVASFWFGVELIQNGTWFINTFVKYQIRLLTTGDASHGGPIYYHLPILLLGCFPASIFLFKAFREPKNEIETINLNTYKLLNIILLSTVVVIFSLVKTKIVHYSSLAYFPITFLAAYGAFNLIENKKRFKIGSIISFLAVGLIMAILVIALPLIGIYKTQLMPYIQDDFVKANLQANVVWSGYEPVIGVILFIGVLAAAFFFIIKRYKLGILVITASVMITFSLLLPFVTPKIEGYTQGAPVEFYQSLIGKDCYVQVLSFKSYADLFYTMKQPAQSVAAVKGVDYVEREKWLLKGKIDKTAYFVTKSQDADGWLKDYGMFGLKLIEKKNGFAFLIREPVK